MEKYYNKILNTVKVHNIQLYVYYSVKFNS